MAKMFYTLEEATERLSTSANQVRDLVSKGQLQEFRDRDKIMFKVEQVELLLGGEDDGGAIPLADSSAGSSITLALDDRSASGVGLGGSGLLGGAGASAGSAIMGGSGSGAGSGIPIEENAKERSGISIFDTDDTEQADPSAVTQVTSTAGGGSGDLTMESVGSGSGLLDLTREGDDTSLGADLLEGVYSGEPGGSATGSETHGTSGLFETTGAASDMSGGMAAAGPGGMFIAAEPYDGAGSGLVGGFALGSLLVCAAAMVVTILGLVGGTAGLLTSFSGNPMMWYGIFAAIVVLCGVVGWALGRRS